VLADSKESFAKLSATVVGVGWSQLGCRDVKMPVTNIVEAVLGRKQVKWDALAPTHIVVMDDIDRRSPGSRRKLENLASYRRLARERFPSAIVRAVVLTNAYDGSFMPKIYAGLGSEASDFSVLDGWRLLPLRLVGDWIEAALTSSASPPPEKMKLFLLDFVEWSKLLDSRQGK
jgi:hypothetical protein